MITRMKIDWLLLLPAAVPALLGMGLALLRRVPAKTLRRCAVSAAAVSAAAAIATACAGDLRLVLWSFTDEAALEMLSDAPARLFSLLSAVIWPFVTLYAVKYMEHEGGERRFYALFMLVFAALQALDYAGNMLTMYLFFEFVTLASAPLVLHSLSRDAVMAALKYLFYSMGGAFVALGGLAIFYVRTGSLAFAAGGVNAAAGDPALLAAAFCMIVGFGAKAGLFPLQSWLPTAHPQAPSPASAVLSGLITKAGVLCVFRSVYYYAGAERIAGTWVQYAWIALALATILIGSTLACREKLLKKRLAYSTVSQVAYILLALAMLNAQSVAGGLMHVWSHALIKDALFLIAGIIIFQTGRERADELTGIGKRMPATMWCFTVCAAALVGIPPAGAFVSKWAIASGALDAPVGALSWIAPVVLLISALLTALYLFPISIQALFAGGDGGGITAKEADGKMLAPVVALTAAAVLIGVFSAPLTAAAEKIAALLF